MPAPHLWDLRDPPTRTKLIVRFGNRAIGERRAAREHTAARHRVQRSSSGPGVCHRHQLTDDERMRSWFYQPGDECSRQAGEPPGYRFVHPLPQPQLFPRQAS